MADAAFPVLGRYRIVAELGRGAMGVVYQAEDALLNRTVAIKTIIMSSDAEERAEYQARFYQEAKAAGGLNHPNIITIHDIGREGEIAYMAMELLEGIELRELMKRGRLPLRNALDFAAQVADGLAYAHKLGVVHRDIKPGNIMIVNGRHAKIMDFGIARMRVSDVKTQAGAILGSPRYMSPEQATGQRADHRSDIFSLGVVAYELAAGEPPFSAPHVSQLMHMVATATPRPPSAVNPELSSVIDLIIAKALEKDPDARYQSAAELAADLRGCLSGLPEQQGGALPALETSAPSEIQPSGTAPAGVEAAEARALGGASEKTAVLAEGVAKTAKSGGYTRATDALFVSRRLDSADALRRLAELAAGGGPQTPPAPLSSRGARDALQRVWQDPDRRLAAAATMVATVVALVIVFW